MARIAGVDIPRDKRVEEKTSPLISFYRDKGLLVSVEANGSVEEITQRITKVLS